MRVATRLVPHSWVSTQALPCLWTSSSELNACKLFQASSTPRIHAAEQSQAWNTVDPNGTASIFKISNQRYHLHGARNVLKNHQIRHLTSAIANNEADGARAYEVWSEFLQKLADPGNTATKPDANKLRLLVKEAIRAQKRRSTNDLVPDRLTSLFMQVYGKAVKREDRRKFFTLLSEDHGVQKEDIDAAVNTWTALTDRQKEHGADMLLAAAQQLQEATQPAYTRLFAAISQQPQGLSFLVRVRAQLLEVLDEQPAYASALRAMSEQLRKALSQWFSVGLLQVQRLHWERSSAQLLENVMQGEAVHPIESWSQLKQRLGRNRRSFCITHAGMPGEPLVVLHTALMQHAAGTMPEILQQDTGSLEAMGESSEGDNNVVVFYSISATQPGLTGVDLGSYLIKSAASQLKAESPYIKQMVTLSPLPNFRAWLLARLTWEVERTGHITLGSSESHVEPPDPLLRPQEVVDLVEVVRIVDSQQSFLADDESTGNRALLWLLENNRWLDHASCDGVLRPVLLRLAARYLVLERRRNRALDPVAHFHLRNGATVWRINWRADLSERGLQRSFGVMVNYDYSTDLAPNNLSYLVHHQVQAAQSVLALLAG